MSNSDRNHNRNRDQRDKEFPKNMRDISGTRQKERRDRSPIDRSNGDRDRRTNNGKFEHQQQQHMTEQMDEIDPNSKKKIASKCRLFVGNLSNEVKEADLKEMFGKYGEITECFLSSKGFGFVRLATRACAEMAKENLDGIAFKGRNLRVRYAVHGASLKINELNPFVSNELLHQAFSMFGEVERAVHILDEKSQPTGEGIVEFERKPGAVDALRRINEGVFLLSSNPRPVFVEPLDPKDDEDGLLERMIPKNNIYQKERMFPPRFALPGSFEFEFGNRWKEIYRIERLRREQLDREIKEAREKLESEMELAFQEYQAAQLREDLRRRQEELEHLEASRRERMEMFRVREEERSRTRQMQMPIPGGQMHMSQFGNPSFLPPYPPNMDNRFADQMREQRSGELPRPPVPPNEEQLSQVQKIMQMMSQGGPNMPPPSAQQIQEGMPRMPLGGARPGIPPSFQEDREYRRSGNSWQSDQERGFRFRS